MAENITSEICRTYLRCPVCHVESALKIDSKSQKIICENCLQSYAVAHDIPALMPPDEIHPLSYRFLGWDNNTRIINPYSNTKNTILSFALYGIASEFLYLFIGVCIWVRKPKVGVRKFFEWTRGTNFSTEVKNALFYGWKNYFNLILKSGEITAFNRMNSYIREPSLEIGCGSCETTNMLFRDSNKVTFGCEYFMDTYLASQEDLYKVIRHYVGGSIKSLPFSSNVFQSVYMVHIIDHITLLDDWFKEIHRIIKPDGFLVMDTYSKNVFDSMPGVWWRSKISQNWAEKYKLWRISKENPNRGGIPLKSDNTYYATGQNLLSLEEWGVVAERYGFELVDYYYFTDSLFSIFLDIEYRGFYPSITGSIPIYLAIDEKINQEKKGMLTEKEAGNIILVFQKK